MDPGRTIPELVAVEPVGTERYRGTSPLGWPGGRIFGGIVAAQAMSAAGATVRDALPHSLHAYFLRLGRPELPLDHVVTRVRDGRSFTTRSVEVAQAGEVILTMVASFHRAEDDEDHQPMLPDGFPLPCDVVDPNRSSTGEVLPHLRVLRDLDVRDVTLDDTDDAGRTRSDGARRTWLRVRGPLPDDPTLHAAIVTFLSDMGTVTAVRPPGSLDPTSGRSLTMAASLDHAVWFHRPPRADEWLCYELASLGVSGARGLARGTMHDEVGSLRVSVVQEALVRTTPGA